MLDLPTSRAIGSDQTDSQQMRSEQAESEQDSLGAPEGAEVRLDYNQVEVPSALASRHFAPSECVLRPDGTAPPRWVQLSCCRDVPSEQGQLVQAVSYTHLTLPTKRIV